MARLSSSPAKCPPLQWLRWPQRGASHVPAHHFAACAMTFTAQRAAEHLRDPPVATADGSPLWSIISHTQVTTPLHAEPLAVKVRLGKGQGGGVFPNSMPHTFNLTFQFMKCHTHTKYIKQNLKLFLRISFSNNILKAHTFQFCLSEK